MYKQKHFAQSDTRVLLELIRTSPLGTIVVNGPDGFVANHIPFIHRPGETALGALCAHIPRANPLSGMLADGVTCLVIFDGAEGYISPSWYATKSEDGRAVPTWNYAVAHVHGTATVIDDADWVHGQICDLTDASESGRAKPWSVSDAPQEYVQGRIAALVGVEVKIERLEGKTKASQNQPRRNQESILAALAREQPDSALHRLMQETLSSRK